MWLLNLTVRKERDYFFSKSSHGVDKEVLNQLFWLVILTSVMSNAWGSNKLEGSCDKGTNSLENIKHLCPNLLIFQKDMAANTCHHVPWKSKNNFFRKDWISKCDIEKLVNRSLRLVYQQYFWQLKLSMNKDWLDGFQVNVLVLSWDIYR